MSIKQRILSRVMILVLVVATLLVPVTAYAGNTVYKDYEYVPAGTTEAVILEAGFVTVTIPAGALPQGGGVAAKVKLDDDGTFSAVFGPDQTFATSIIVDFGPDVEIVYYYSDAGPVLVNLVDGKLITNHFSRYSGW